MTSPKDMRVLSPECCLMRKNIFADGIKDKDLEMRWPNLSMQVLKST